MKRNSFYFIILIILSLTIVSCSLVFYKKEDKNFVKLSGNIDIKQVNLAFKVAGQLVDLKVDEGDYVKAGDILAELDEEPYRVKYNQAIAKKEQAKASFENVNLLFKRNNSLCKKKLISQQECDNLIMQKRQVEANLKLANNIVEEAKLNLNYTKLYAFEDGVILTKIYENGSILGAGHPVYSEILNKKMWVRTYIDEVNLGKIKLGEKVKIYADFTDKIYEGHIGFISPIAEFTPKNIETESLRPDLVYKLRIIIDNADDYLKQGMPVSVTVNK